MKKSSLLTLLTTLNNLLIRERIAISQLKMEELAELQHHKTKLLEKIHSCKDEIDDNTRELAAKVKAGNRRNAWLLRTGLQLISHRQDNVRRRLALTYAPYGRTLQVDTSPKILDRRL